MGRATSLICAYRKVDKKKGQVCNLDREFMMTQIFNKSCIYCKSIQNIGCDRIDNTIGHIKTNVVPCCRICNTTRIQRIANTESET